MMEELLPELQEIIWTYLEPPDLMNLRLTSKRTSGAATQVFFFTTSATWRPPKLEQALRNPCISKALTARHEVDPQHDKVFQCGRSGCMSLGLRRRRAAAYPEIYLKQTVRSIQFHKCSRHQYHVLLFYRQRRRYCVSQRHAARALCNSTSSPEFTLTFPHKYPSF